MVNAKKKGLGKGLGALIGGNASKQEPLRTAEKAATDFQPTSPDGARLVYLDPTQIQPNPKQPRRTFDEDALEELANSIRKDGVQEPVLVRRVGDHYELVSGERRVRASVMADVNPIPAICRDISDSEMLKLGLIENIQREDLNAIELALAYHELLEQFGWTQEQLAAEVGKNRATVTNTLRLLNLQQEVQQKVASGELSMGHAKALLSMQSQEQQLAAARRIIAQGLSVRQAEQLALEMRPKQKTPPARDPNVITIEDDLRRSLGTKVFLKTQGNGRGRIEIDYYSNDDLDRILQLLCSKP